ncbi:hypothetical protein D3C72_1365600 [compost metagenome]
MQLYELFFQCIGIVICHMRSANPHDPNADCHNNIIGIECTIIRRYLQVGKHRLEVYRIDCHFGPVIQRQVSGGRINYNFTRMPLHQIVQVGRSLIPVCIFRFCYENRFNFVPSIRHYVLMRFFKRSFVQGWLSVSMTE